MAIIAALTCPFFGATLSEGYDRVTNVDRVYGIARQIMVCAPWHGCRSVGRVDEMRGSKTPELVERTDPEMLTPSEIENLRRIAKEQSAYGRIAFKNHKIDLGVKDDADLDTRADATTSDAPPARSDAATQEQPGGASHADAAERDRTQGVRRSVLETLAQ